MRSSSPETRVSFILSAFITGSFGDFDGDGKDDPGIWRSSQGVWIIPRSSANYTTFIFSQWGQLGDSPLPGSLTQR